MKASKLGELFKKSYQKYQKTNNRVTFELKELVQLAKLIENLPNHIIALTSNQLTAFGCLKLLMLVHRLLIEELAYGEWVAEMVGGLRMEHTNQLTKLLEQKLITPYKLYLQKRSVIDNIFELKLKKQNKVIKFYHLLNLINCGTAFSEILYTFGRYYADKYLFAIDFNIVLAQDLLLVYNQMIKCVNRPASTEILDEIELMHEKMYVVYYNCYFHKFVKTYTPKWVLTDLKLKNHSKSQLFNTTPIKKNSKILSDSSIKSTAASKKFLDNSMGESSLADSCLFLREEEEENCEQVSESFQEKIDLLKSMERVVELFDESN